MYDVLTDPNVSVFDIVKPTNVPKLTVAPARISLAKVESKLLGEIDGHFRLKDKFQVVQRVGGVRRDPHRHAAHARDDHCERARRVHSHPDPDPVFLLRARGHGRSPRDDREDQEPAESEPPDPRRRDHASRQAHDAREGHPGTDRPGLQGEALQDDDLEVHSTRGVARVSRIHLHVRSAFVRRARVLQPDGGDSRPVSKRRGLPESSRMRHDSHFVDQLVRADELPVGRRIAIHLIEANPDQPRSVMGDLSELTKSIVDKGVLEPILVRPRGDGRFTIISGERRFRASLDAGLAEIPCIEMDVPDNELLEIALIENLQRKDLSPFEEAEGYRGAPGTPRLHARADRRRSGEVARHDHGGALHRATPRPRAGGMSARRHRLALVPPRARDDSRTRTSCSRRWRRWRAARA